MARKRRRDGVRRYLAPALEKGLDVLELLANEVEPLHIVAIMERLGRSRGELHRTLQVLVNRGFINHEYSETTFRLTDRLFTLGVNQPHVTNILAAAMPPMRELVYETGESCHLTLTTRGETVVIARVESGEQVGFSVRVGYRRPIPDVASGLVLYAFQGEAVRRSWEAYFALSLDPVALTSFRCRADQVRTRCVEIMPSSHAANVTDVSVPVLCDHVAVAALTVPFLARVVPICSIEQITKGLLKTAVDISGRLVAADRAS